MQHADPVEQLRSVIIPQRCAGCRARHTGNCQVVTDEDPVVVERYRSGKKSLAKGRHLYHEGEATGEIFSLVDGWVALYHLLPDGRRQILEFMLPGSLIGYLPDRAARMTHSAECITPATVCLFPKERFRDLLRENPDAAVRMIHMCARNHVFMHQHLTDLGRRNALERMAHFLLEFYLRLEDEDLVDHAGSVSLPLKQEDLGDALGLSRVRVNRLLQELQQQGLVELGRGVIKVAGPIELAGISGLSIGEKPRRAGNGNRRTARLQ